MGVIGLQVQFNFCGLYSVVALPGSRNVRSVLMLGSFGVP